MTFSEHVTGSDEINDANPATPNLIDREFDTLVAAFLDTHHVPGMSVAIVHNGNIQCKVCVLFNLEHTARCSP